MSPAIASWLSIADATAATAWRVGRLLDPAGHQWEIGKPLR
jgi:hypothetical protein